MNKHPTIPKNKHKRAEYQGPPPSSLLPNKPLFGDTIDDARQDRRNSLSDDYKSLSKVYKIHLDIERGLWSKAVVYKCIQPLMRRNKDDLMFGLVLYVDDVAVSDRAGRQNSSKRAMALKVMHKEGIAPTEAAEYLAEHGIAKLAARNAHIVAAEKRKSSIIEEKNEELYDNSGELIENNDEEGFNGPYPNESDDESNSDLDITEDQCASDGKLEDEIAIEITVKAADLEILKSGAPGIFQFKVHIDEAWEDDCYNFMKLLGLRKAV